MNECPIKLAFDEFFQSNPYQVMASWREAGPVQRIVIPDGRQGWLVTRYHDAVAILSNPTISSDLTPTLSGDLTRQQGEPQLLDPDVSRVFEVMRQGKLINMDPPDHTRLRKRVVREFSARRVEELRPHIQQITDGLLKELAGCNRVDLVADFTYVLPLTVICDLLGIPETDRMKFRAWIDMILRFLGDPQDAQPTLAALKASNDYFTELLAIKRRQPSDDLLSALAMTDGEAEPLTDDELMRMAKLLFAAGHETTSQFISLGVLALLRTPEQRTAFQQDPTLLSTTIDEMLRYDSPSTPGLFRYTAVDIEVDGVTIPAGSLILVATAAANRDPARFLHADTLDLGRSDNPHLAFGWGIHYCLGARLGKAMGEIALRTLFRRFPALELAVPVEKLRWRQGYIRALEELPVCLGLVAAE